MTQVKGRVGGPCRLLTAASLPLSDRCTEKRPHAGDDAIMCGHLRNRAQSCSFHSKEEV